MREPPWRERFDVVLSWFTSFGYFDDDGNRAVLTGAFGALRPGGRFVVDLNNRDWILRNYRAQQISERDDDLLVMRSRFDVQSGRNVEERVVVRGGRTRRFEAAVRLFSLTELRGWLVGARFEDVAGYGRDGATLTIEHPRMVVVAGKPG